MFIRGIIFIIILLAKLSAFAADVNLVANAKGELLFINVKSDDNPNCYVNNSSKNITFICNKPISKFIRNSLYYGYFKEASFSSDRKQVSLPLKAKDVFAIKKSNDKNSFQIIGNKRISSKIELVKDTKKVNKSKKSLSKKIVSNIDNIKKKNKDKEVKNNLSAKKSEVNKKAIVVKESKDLQMVRLYSDEKFISLEFPISTKVASAAFEREGYFWLVFNNKENIDISSIKDFFMDVKIIPDKKNLIIRFAHNLSGEIKSESKNDKWIFKLSRNKSTLLMPITTLMEYSNPGSLGLAFLVEKKADLVRVVDPDIKDYITIIPMGKVSSGIAIKRNFIDFNLPKTAQGLVVIEKSDNIKVGSHDNYVEIISSNYVSDLEIGSDISDISRDALEDSIMPSTRNTKTLLPYFDGIRYLDENFSNDKAALFRAIAKSGSVEEINKNRFNLLRFFFKHNFFKEAGISLSLIERSNPKFFESNIRLRFLKGVLYALNNNNIYAVRIFNDIINDPKLSKSFLDEVNLWINYNLSLQDADMGKMGYVKNANKFIFTYSSKLQWKIVLAELEYLLKQKNISKQDFNDITYILDNMSNPPDIHTKYFEDSLAFFVGKYYAVKGDTNIAKGYFKKLINNWQDSHNRSRSEFELVKIEEKTGLLSRESAIKRLEKISSLWRGGNLEYDIMLVMADFYKKDRKLVHAMRVYNYILHNFPRHSKDIDVTNNIAKLFNNIFKPGGYVEILDDFTVVSLFNEFRELTPIGSSGDQIVISIAKRLLNLDLLDSAEKLLRYQVDYRLKFDEKVSIANNLSLLYIMNDKSEKAVEILNKTDKYNYSYEEYLERLRIKAHAFIQQKKYSEVLKLISQDRSFDADLLREEVYFKEEKWNNLMPMLELKLKDKLNTKTEFGEYEAKDIVKLAIAYAMTDNKKKLNYMKNNLKIANENIKNVINYLSYYPEDIDYSDIAVSSGITHFSEFLDIYKKKLF